MFIFGEEKEHISQNTWIQVKMRILIDIFGGRADM
jgi:hypothetical protein